MALASASLPSSRSQHQRRQSVGPTDARRVGVSGYNPIVGLEGKVQFKRALLARAHKRQWFASRLATKGQQPRVVRTGSLRGANLRAS